MSHPQDLEHLLRVVESIEAENREDEEDAPTDEELTEARAELVNHLRAAAEGDDPDVEAGRSIRSAIERIDGEMTTREERREQARTEARALLEGLTQTPEAEDEPEGEEQTPEGEEQTPPESVATSLRDAIQASRTRAETRQVPEEPETDVIVSSVGVAQGHPLSPNATLGEAAAMFHRFAGQVKRGSGVIIHMEKLYPEERQLTNSAVENTRAIDDVAGLRAITAAGGVCDPLPADFSHPICGDRGRPIRDSLPAFRADRGGIRFAPSATVADLEPAITLWTHATDVDPGTATKDCPRIDCEDELTAHVDAVVACLTVGNFQARFNPEFWRSRLDLLMVAHDRIAEQTLFATMLAGSTATTYAGGAGTIVDLLQSADKAVAGIRSRHRLIGTQFRAIFPAWTRDALRAHLASQLPAGTTDLFSVADAQLNGFFTSRGITPAWSPDLDEFGAQGAGALLDFPGGDVQYLVHPEGSFLFLDGGTLDLGTSIQDSTLNQTNDRQAFMETFEQVVFRGCEALAVTVPVSEDCICGPLGS